MRMDHFFHKEFQLELRLVIYTLYMHSVEMHIYFLKKKTLLKNLNNT